MSEHVTLGILWMLFGLLHSLLASVWLKKRLTNLMGKTFIYYRLFYTLFAFASFAFVIHYQLKITPYRLFYPNAATNIAGWIIMLTGIVIMGLCIHKYFMSLSGLKALFKEEDTSYTLMISGIHRYMRHPLYLGTFLTIWGLLFILPFSTFLIANCVITIYTLIGIKWEEEKLVLMFGDSYLNYKKEVPKLIPFIGNK